MLPPARGSPSEPAGNTDNHIKMMDALHHLDSYSLQFICKSVEALCRERMPTQAPPGYHMPQASDIPWGLTNNPLLSQEFYRAASNLGTAIVEPQQVPPQQCLAGNCCPDPEIESAIANMHRHEQVSGMPSMDSNNNPWWGRSLSCPPHCTLHLTAVAVYLVPQEFRTRETQGSRPLLIGYVTFTICSCNPCIFITWIFVSFYRMCSFQENRVNIFALCSRPYRYLWFISGLATLASCVLSFQTAIHYNVCLKYLILGNALYCNIVAVLLYCVQFFRFNIQFQESLYPELFVGGALIIDHLVGLLYQSSRLMLWAPCPNMCSGCPLGAHCSLIFYILYDAYSVILPYCYLTMF